MVISITHSFQFIIKYLDNIWIAGDKFRKCENDLDYLSDSYVGFPEHYPALLVTAFEKSFDRTGNCEIRIAEYVYLSDFNGGKNGIWRFGT